MLHCMTSPWGTDPRQKQQPGQYTTCNTPADVVVVNATLQGSASLLSISSSKLMANVAAAGGGVHLGLRSAGSVMGGSIVANTAIRQGGGIKCLDCALLRVVGLLKHNRAREVSSSKPLIAATSLPLSDCWPVRDARSACTSLPHDAGWSTTVCLPHSGRSNLPSAQC
jgi:hypothetical protein